MPTSESPRSSQFANVVGPIEQAELHGHEDRVRRGNKLGAFIAAKLSGVVTKVLGVDKLNKHLQQDADESNAQYLSGTYMLVPKEPKGAAELQNEAEATYADFGSIIVETAGATERLTRDDIVERMETDHVVKEAPRFAEQVGDVTRTNPIMYMHDMDRPQPAAASDPDFTHKRTVMTEHDMLVGMDTFLRDVEEYARGEDTLVTEHDFAKALRENLTFIGQKEYLEATRGIADYWKALLDKNPDQQILAVTGKINSIRVKSDQYLLEHILQNFTDEEAEKYHKRLIVDAEDVTATDPKNLRIVVLDDWTISGSQLRYVVSHVKETLPGFEASVEMQLVAAREQRIKDGFNATSESFNDPKDIRVPLRAYYMAHHSDHAIRSSAHITGFHSSVDYDFETTIGWTVATLQRQGAPQNLQTMPPLTNIVRPYRREGGYPLTQRDRFRTGVKISAGLYGLGYDSLENEE